MDEIITATTTRKLGKKQLETVMNKEGLTCSELRSERIKNSVTLKQYKIHDNNKHLERRRRRKRRRRR